MNKELLSALMDDEASGFEIRRSVQLLSESEAARNQLDRYELIAAALRDQLPPFDACGFAGGVRELIEAEVAGTSRHLGSARAIATYAVAATVTAAAVFGIWQLQETHQSPAAPTLASGSDTDAGQTFAASAYEPLARLPQTHLPPAAENTSPDTARMSSYLVNHSESSPPAVIPFARLVGYNNH